MRLSRSFDTSEFECRCGCGFGRSVTHISPLLIGGLQTLRDYLGRPIRISSGCRCAKHNRAVGGAIASQHLSGKAADIVIDGLTVDEIAEAVERIPVFRAGGVKLYPTWVHVDVRNGRWRDDARRSGK